MNEKILNDVKAMLLTDNVSVETKEDGENITVGILIGKGKKGGLPVSFTSTLIELPITLEIVLKMLQAQLALYGIECINKGKVVDVSVLDTVYAPEITSSFIHNDLKVVNENIKCLASTMLSFNLFKNTYFDKLKNTIE